MNKICQSRHNGLTLKQTNALDWVVLIGLVFGASLQKFPIRLGLFNKREVRFLGNKSVGRHDIFPTNFNFKYFSDLNSRLRIVFKFSESESWFSPTVVCKYFNEEHIIFVFLSQEGDKDEKKSD